MIGVCEKARGSTFQALVTDSSKGHDAELTWADAVCVESRP